MTEGYKKRQYERPARQIIKSSRRTGIGAKVSLIDASRVILKMLTE